eukprot:4972664-Amphidinium_carterae.1
MDLKSAAQPTTSVLARAGSERKSLLMSSPSFAQQTKKEIPLKQTSKTVQKRMKSYKHRRKKKEERRRKKKTECPNERKRKFAHGQAVQRWEPGLHVRSCTRLD